MLNLLTIVCSAIVAYTYTTKDKPIETIATDFKKFPYQWCLN